MAVEEMYEKMKAKLEGIVPDFELRAKAELADRIMTLKKEKNAVILAHNYMEPALFHSVPDFVGDSLQLSRDAAASDADVIVFCGVRFMAETAKILNPSKMVLCPGKVAGCSLAESITAEDVRNLKKQFPGVPVVTYINTYADVKAETDICCTSGNAKKVVESLGTDQVIFLPDEFLAANVARETGLKIIYPTKNPLAKFDELDYQMIGWQGRCEVHERFTVEDITNARKQFPDVVVLTHPGCPPDGDDQGLATGPDPTSDPHPALDVGLPVGQQDVADPGEHLVAAHGVAISSRGRSVVRPGDEVDHASGHGVSGIRTQPGLHDPARDHPRGQRYPPIVEVLHEQGAIAHGCQPTRAGPPMLRARASSAMPDAWALLA